jgi:hypothetical protein
MLKFDRLKATHLPIRHLASNRQTTIQQSHLMAEIWRTRKWCHRILGDKSRLHSSRGQNVGRVVFLGGGVLYRERQIAVHVYMYYSQ